MAGETEKQNTGLIIDLGPRTLVIDGSLGGPSMEAKVGNVTLEIVDASDKQIARLKSHDIRLKLRKGGD